LNICDLSLQVAAVWYR